MSHVVNGRRRVGVECLDVSIDILSAICMLTLLLTLTLGVPRGQDVPYSGGGYRVRD